MLKPVAEAIKTVKKAKADVNALLKEPTLMHNLLEINAYFERIETRLGYVASVMEPAKTSSPTSPFKPLTKFMGQKLDKKKSVKETVQTIAEARAKDFLAKVEKMWGSIQKLAASSILESFRTPDDEKVIRGVAKRADMKDFKDAELTVEYIETIQTAVAKKKVEIAKQEEIDKKAKSQASDNDDKKTGGKE